jgi:Ca2+-binding EF-hand superfamily protein
MAHMTDQKHRRIKKSETLEVRIPYETKQAFLTACREDGTTASEVVRESVQTYLDERERPIPQEKRTLVMKLPQPVRRYGLRAAAGGAIAVGFTVLAVLPSAASPDFAALFKTMDANGDGVLTAEEFAGSRRDGNNQTTTQTITRTIKGDKPPVPSPPGTEIKQDAFAFWLPGEDGGSTTQVNNVQRREVRVVVEGHGPDAATSTPTPPSMDDIRAAEFRIFDTDKDGKVSLLEFQARHRAMLTRGFEILDGNKDGSLTQAEYAQIANPPIPALGGDPPVPTPPTPPGDGRPKLTPEVLKANFVKLDANEDGKLSLQEYLPPV